MTLPGYRWLNGHDGPTKIERRLRQEPPWKEGTMSDGTVELAKAGEVLPVVSQRIELGTLRASEPGEVIAAAERLATPLAKLIKDRHLASNIQGKEYVRCEGWTTLAAMLGVTPHEVSVTEHGEGIFTATVELRRLVDGAPVARASAECGAEDEVWGKRARYARRSMALTRATAKACRLAFSWVMVLAGYEATPAEEIPQDETVRLPGSPQKWGGNGGKPITEVPTAILRQARDWFKNKDAQKNAALIAAMDEELEERREAEPEGSAEREEAPKLTADDLVTPAMRITNLVRQRPGLFLPSEFKELKAWLEAPGRTLAQVLDKEAELEAKANAWDAEREKGRTRAPLKVS